MGQAESAPAGQPASNAPAAAQKAFEEGTALLRQQTADSFRAAIEKFNQSAKLWRSAGDPRQEALALLWAGRAYDNLGESPKALDCYNQALPLSRAAGEHATEAVLLFNIGATHELMGENQPALDNYGQALTLFHAGGDGGAEAKALISLGNVHYKLGEKQKALDGYQQALPLAQAAGDRETEARSLIGSAVVDASLGENQQALELYTKALPLEEAAGDTATKALTLTNIGTLYHDSSDMRQALAWYEKALPEWRAAGDRNGEAITLNNLGEAYAALGEEQKAMDYYNQALAIKRTVGSRASLAATLGNIAELYRTLGVSQKGLDEYAEALALQRADGDRRGESASLEGMGNFYGDLGEREKELAYFNQALAVAKADGNQQGQAEALNNVGVAYQESGDEEKALDYLIQAYRVELKVGDRRGQASTLGHIGTGFANLGDTKDALDYFERALTTARAIGDPAVERMVLDGLGNVYEKQHEDQKALDYYNQALAVDRATGDRNGEAVTLGNVALAESDQGNLSDARVHMEAALDIMESLRTAAASEQLRTSYFSTVQGNYATYIDILMRLHARFPRDGYDRLALEASERGRARSLLETLNEGHADIRQGVDPKLLEQERTLQQLLDAKSDRLTRLLLGPHSDEQEAAARKDIDNLQSQYQDLEAQIRAASPHYAALTQPQPLTVTEMQQQLLDPETVLLEYAQGRDQSYLFAVTPDSLSAYTLPKADEIEALVTKLYPLLTQPAGQQMGAQGRGFQAVQNPSGAVSAQQFYPLMVRLSRMVLGPAAPQLGRKRLVIVPDGALNYIPFGALPAPASGSPDAANPKPLVAEHEIVYLPSASTLSVLRKDTAGRKPAPKLLAVMADPVFSADDARVTSGRTASAGGAADGDSPSPAKQPGAPGERGAPNLAAELVESQLTRSALDAGVTRGGGVPRLPFTRQEADAIAALVAPDQRSEALGFAASKASATSGALGEYRLVHFATHGMLDSEHPELSGVVLSLVDAKGQPVDGFLRLQDIFNLNLPADLVVLSACETGLGKEIRGEGLVGLTRGFMYAGAPRVVVSLWSVNDQATAELMKRFYRGMLVEKLTPAAALRAAQMALAHDPRWAAPYYWAAFVLQGEWK
ncbi:MAG TPA: CHAT domain-containing protein [Terriglobia bacterium]|nr:CHAT domain-containing protein [Terriglobia bacterium]